jgi:hypothetical protein
MSTGAHMGGGSRSRSTRHSPPPRGGYARSDPVDVGAMPPSHYASNIHSPPPGSRERYPSDLDDEISRSYSSRRPPDRKTSVPASDDDYTNGRQIPQRNMPPPNPPGYDSAYSSGGHPPPTNGSFAHRSNLDHNGERRRSFYQGSAAPPPANNPMAPGGGGIDGYGSYAGNGPTYGASGH